MKILSKLIILLALLTSFQTQADDDEKLSVRFTGVEEALLTNVQRNVRLYSRLNESDPLSDGERRRLQRRIIPEIKQALEPFGYYNATVKRNLEVSSKTLQYDIQLNAPVRVQAISLTLSDDAVQQSEFVAWRKNFPLSTGTILMQSLYEQAKKALIADALRLGYFDAKYTQNEIIINEARTQARIVLAFDSGKRYRISAVNLNWQVDGDSGEKVKRRVKDEVLDALITVNEGDLYDSDKLSKTQQNLAATPYFASVNIQPGETNTETQTVPIEISLSPSKRKAYSAEIGVGTDTGVRGGIGYENRRINSRGHTVSIRFGGSEIKRSAIANYRIPLPKRATDSLNFFSSLEEEIGDSRRFQATKVGSELSLGSKGSLYKFALTASREKFIRIDNALVETEQVTDLLMPSARWERVVRDDLYFPTKGWSASATFRVADKSVASDIDLAQMILDGKALMPLGKGRIKIRARLASSLIDEAVDLPASLGFLAGGDDSVRGYKYESIGVTRDGQVTVGKNLIVGSLEYQYPIINDIALATFIDAGDAFNGNADYKRGAGLGLRWRLPFGAMRFDLASALDLDGDPWRVHFSFGTDL